MKALVLEASRTLVYKDVEDRSPGKREVKIQIKAAGICGSDVHGYDGSSGRRSPPVIMGHEGSGIITAVGEEVKDWKPGDRVTFDSTIYNQNDWFSLNGHYNLSENRRVLGVSCNEYKQDGIFTEYVILPEHILYPIPDHVTFEEAALTEPLSVALHALNVSRASPGDHVMVVGAGVIGLMVLQALMARGFKHVVVADIDPDKLRMARELGASIMLNPDVDDIKSSVGQVTDYRGMDVVFEAVGIQKTVDLSFEGLRKGGTITLIGNLSPTVQMPLQQIVTQEIRVQGSCAICGEYPEALRLLEEEKINSELMISKTEPLADGQEWFDRLYNKEKGLLKVILRP